MSPLSNKVFIVMRVCTFFVDLFNASQNSDTEYVFRAISFCA